MNSKQNRNSLYIHSEGADWNSLIKGFQWLLTIATEPNKSSVLLAVPSASVLDKDIKEILRADNVKILKKEKYIRLSSTISMSLMTPQKRLTSHKGPVLAVYATTDLLNKIDDLSDVTDVLVIPWSRSEVQYWIDTWNAKELDSTEGKSSESVFSDPVVEQALLGLTESVNLSTGIGHPVDKAKTIDLFKRLKKAKIDFDPDEIRGWLVRHSWDTKSADRVRTIATKIKQGK